MVAMLNKNLRTVLYYVVTVSVLCLMIEVTKRIPDPRTQLSPHYYEVELSTGLHEISQCPFSIKGFHLRPSYPGLPPPLQCYGTQRSSPLLRAARLR